LNSEVLKAVGDPQVRRKLEELGFAVQGSSAEDLRIMTRDQLAKYARVIKEMGIAAE
jgi:tripartite-type tricarboxylate transporter receptor subunit TctC